MGAWETTIAASMPGATYIASIAGMPKSSGCPSTRQHSWKGRSLHSLRGDQNVSSSSPRVGETSAYRTPGDGIAASCGPLLGLLPSKPAVCTLFTCNCQELTLSRHFASGKKAAFCKDGRYLHSTGQNPCLGHRALLILPCLPFLRWHYQCSQAGHLSFKISSQEVQCDEEQDTHPSILPVQQWHGVGPAITLSHPHPE